MKYEDYIKEKTNAIINGDYADINSELFKMINAQSSIMRTIYDFCINEMWETYELATVKTDPTCFMVCEILEIEENKKGFVIIFEGQTWSFGSFHYNKFMYKCSPQCVYIELYKKLGIKKSSDRYYESIELVK